MNSTFATTKYAATRLAFANRMKKASAWVREHRKVLSWSTSIAALLALTWVLSQHGGWGALTIAHLHRPELVALAVALWPLNLGLEAWKWRVMSSKAIQREDEAAQMRGWRTVWREVMAGQTWATLGPLRWADGLGRLALAPESCLKGQQGAVAFAKGAAAQGWATWCWAIPALFMWDWPMLGAAAVLGVVAGGVLLIRNVPTVIMGLSLIRYVVFALQYLLFLTAFGATSWHQWWVDACPRIAAVWCAVGTLPWPAELGVREAAAAWAFDDHLPAVVAATFGLWLLNRGGSALVGAVVVGQMWHSPQSS